MTTEPHSSNILLPSKLQAEFLVSWGAEYLDAVFEGEETPWFLEIDLDVFLHTKSNQDVVGQLGGFYHREGYQRVARAHYSRCSAEVHLLDAWLESRVASASRFDCTGFPSATITSHPWLRLGFALFGVAGHAGGAPLDWLAENSPSNYTAHCAWIRAVAQRRAALGVPCGYEVEREYRR